MEFLRTYPGSRVNNHVARFVAWGRHSEHVVSEHPWNYPYGLGTPLDLFLELDGKIILLGCDHDNTTFLHYVEHVADFPGKRVAQYLVPVERDGVRVWLETEEFDTSGDGAHPDWPERFFAQIVDGYLERNGNRGRFVGDARTFLLPARELFEYALPRMQAVAAGQP